jgi:hypothetical protein
MRAAQIALALLIGVLLTAGTVLLIFEEDVGAWILLGFGLFGFVIVMGMVAADGRVTE